MKNMKKIIYICFFAVIIIASSGLLYRTLKQELVFDMANADSVELAGHKQPTYGIDISHHQPLAIWDSFNKDTINIVGVTKRNVGLKKKIKISFVYIKASQSSGFKDPLCVEHFKKAKQHGLSAGFYHFYSIRTSPEKQYRNFKSQLKKVETDLPPVIDFEHIAEHIKTQEQKQRVWNNFMKFYKLVRNNYGVEPIVYLNDGDWRMFFKGRKGFKTWLPGYSLYDGNQILQQRPHIILKNKIFVDFNEWYKW